MIKEKIKNTETARPEVAKDGKMKIKVIIQEVHIRGELTEAWGSFRPDQEQM